MALCLEGLSTLICIQSLGKKAKSLADRSEAEGVQFGMLIGAAAAYVGSAWWIIMVSLCSPSLMLRVEIRVVDLPLCRDVSIVLDTDGSMYDCACIPHCHRICTSSHQRRRIERDVYVFGEPILPCTNSLEKTDYEDPI